GEVVGSGVDDDRSLLTRQQVVQGEGVRGGHQHPDTVPANLQRGEIPAGGLVRVAGRLEVAAGGAAGGSNRIGLALADLVDVHSVEAGCDQPGAGRRDRDGGIAVAEVEL